MNHRDPLVSTFHVGDPRPNTLSIGNDFNKPLVTIDLKTGDLTFGEGYEPDDTARIFWIGIIGHEYREFLDWKRQRGVDPVGPHHYVPSIMHMGDCAVCGHLQGDAIHRKADA